MSEPAGTCVGQPLERIDGRAKVTGAARFAAEFSRPKIAEAILVQSTIAKGRIVAIDIAAARRAPGVLAVLTHQNAPKLQMPKSAGGAPGQSAQMGEKRLPLADETISYVGDIVAIVVAENLEQAQHAASRISVRYAQETPVLDFEAAESSATYPKSGLGGQPAQHRRGDVDAALAAPDIVKVEASYRVPVETNNPMEMSGTIAEWSGDSLTVHDATQGVVGTRDLLSKAFSIPLEHVRVICPFTGGGFGCKGHQWPHTLAAAMAARVVNRPVRLTLTRAQMFTSVGHRPPTLHRLALAARRDGRLTAMRHETVNATSPVTDFVAACGVVTTKLHYECENVDTPAKLVRVNVGAPTPMRAPAECPGSFALESAMDELAVALSIDPLKLRLDNYAEKDPSTGKPWSSKRLRECYERGAAKFGWRSRRAEPGSMKDGEWLVGWGMASANYPGNRWPCSARVRVTADGHAIVQTSTQELGTGSYTVFSQVAADALGLPVGGVTLELGDTDFPAAPLSAGSCSAASVSEAVVQACAAAKSKVDGGGDDLVAAIKRAGLPEVAGEASVRLEEEKSHSHTIQSFAAQFCEVKVDPLLRSVRVTRFVSAVDVGRVLNRRTCRSQIVGAVVMGIGMALSEQTVYDLRTGRPVTDNFADYLVPVNADIGQIDVELVEYPDPIINSLGCRGAGEIGIVGVAAAVANAVYHATGKRVRDLPITVDKLL